MNGKWGSDTHKLKEGDQSSLSPGTEAALWDVEIFSFKIGMVLANGVELLTLNGRQLFKTENCKWARLLYCEPATGWEPGVWDLRTSSCHLLKSPRSILIGLAWSCAPTEPILAARECTVLIGEPSSMSLTAPEPRDSSSKEGVESSG